MVSRDRLEQRAEELNELEAELLKRGEALDAYAAQVERRSEGVDAKYNSLRKKWTSVEASRLLVSALEKKTKFRETSVDEEMRKFLREIAHKQKELAEVERERVALLEEAERRLEETHHLSAGQRAAEERLAQSTAQCRQLESTVFSLSEEELRLQARVDDLQAAAARAGELQEALQQKLASMRSEMEPLEAKLDQARDLEAREARVKEVERDVAALRAQFGDEVQKYGGLGNWLRDRGRSLAADAAAVGAREVAVGVRERAVEALEIKERDVLEAKKRLAAKEERLEWEREQASTMRTQADQNLAQMEERREAVERTERNAAVLTRSLEAREQAVQRKEREVTEALDSAREVRVRSSARLVALTGREKDLDAREKALATAEAELQKREEQFVRERTQMDTRATEGEKRSIAQKIERLRGVAISLDAPEQILASVEALAEEIGTTPWASKHDVEVWESQLLKALTAVHRLRGLSSSSRPVNAPPKEEEHASSNLQRSPFGLEKSSSSGKEFREFRQALGRGRRVEDIISEFTTPAGLVRSETRFPIESAKQPPITESRSAPAMLLDTTDKSMMVRDNF